MPGQGLVGSLFAGRIDVIGDVHGEISALETLLHRLGYGESGHHSQGRRLVFVGDLTDRGPDSHAVLDLVRGLVGRGRAQCVLGNHEFNILADRPKPENSWFLSDAPPLLWAARSVAQKEADPMARQAILDFFAQLPLALEREDLRVVHACWDEEMIDVVRAETEVLPVYRQYRDRIAASAVRAGLDAVDSDLAHQNGNPVKLLTSGPETRTQVPWELNGKLRLEIRVPWWESYRDGVLCVFGHYWRTALPADESVEHFFDGLDRRRTLGPGPAMCIDYSVGKRYRERFGADFTGEYRTQLAALRLPERVLIYDNEDAAEPLAAPARGPG
jgi:hypothetical protein